MPMLNEPSSRQSIQFRVDSATNHFSVFQVTLSDINKITQNQTRTLRMFMGQRINEFKRRINLLKSKWEDRKP
jgi:hypothetical protein